MPKSWFTLVKNERGGWGWDPKETGSLITWLIYEVLLYARLMQRRKGRRAALFPFSALGSTYPEDDRFETLDGEGVALGNMLLPPKR